MSSPAILTSESSTATDHDHDHDSNPHSTHSSSRTPEPNPRPMTPDAPPYSPLTPTVNSTHLPAIPALPQLNPSSPNSTRRAARSSRSQQSVHEVAANDYMRPPVNSMPRPPPPVPISEDTNPDIVAVRAALDVLQIQRKRATADIDTLRRVKERALGDPQGFAERVARGEVSAERRAVELRVPMVKDDMELEAADGDEEMAEDEAGKMEIDEGAFVPLPQPQDVVRCPPINWGKYHVAENVLDVLHEEQRRRPSDGRMGLAVEAAPEHVVAAPYRPFVDLREQTSPNSRSGNIRKRTG